MIPTERSICIMKFKTSYIELLSRSYGNLYLMDFKTSGHLSLLVIETKDMPKNEPLSFVVRYVDVCVFSSDYNFACCVQFRYYSELNSSIVFRSGCLLILTVNPKKAFFEGYNT